jgi:hypothetical protein
VPEHSDTTAEDGGYTRGFQEVNTGIKTMPKGGFEPDSISSTNRTPCGQSPDTSGQPPRTASRLTPVLSLVFP